MPTWLGPLVFVALVVVAVVRRAAGLSFAAGDILSLAVILRLALQKAGDRFWATLGLLAYLFGAVFFVMHLGFRLTVMPLAVEEFRRVGAAPGWYEPWRRWAGLGFGIYHVLAYLALVAYGIALLKTRIVPRAAAWLCIGFALLAVPWFGPPLLIHMMPWVLGALILTGGPVVPEQDSASNPRLRHPAHSSQDTCAKQSSITTTRAR